MFGLLAAALPARAQNAEPMVYTVGLVTEAGGQHWAYLHWRSTALDLFEPRIWSVWRKNGQPNAPGDYELVAVVRVQTSAATIGAVSPGVLGTFCSRLPPRVPKVLRVENDYAGTNQHHLRLLWAANPPEEDKTTTGYAIYRWQSTAQMNALGGNPTANLVTIVPHTPDTNVFSYLDNGPGSPAAPADYAKTFWFTVRAIDNSGAASACAIAPFGGNLSGHSPPVPGVAVRVTAYADLSASACASETLEVIRLGDDLLASVTGVPLPSPTDTDGNLLDDDWERLFLGGQGSDPFAGLGSGYTLLQAYLDGADPALPGSYGQRPPAHLAPPAVDISRLNPTTLQLLWQFPAAYAPRLEFKLQEVTALGGLWENLPAAVEDLGGGHYRMLASAPVGNTAFWRLTLRLR
jgi:hypothetical protein